VVNKNMNLEDLAKQTIDEVSVQLKEKQRQEELLKEQENVAKEQILYEQTEKTLEEYDDTKEEVKENYSQELEFEIQKAKFEEEQKILPQESQTEILDPSVMLKAQNFSQDLFLKNLRERILVLFEGLNNIPKDSLEQKLQLTINFLEFLLANIEDKLKK